MKYGILIIGSTGQLGSKLLKYLAKENISVDTITCYKNEKKILNQKKKFKVKSSYILSDFNQKNDFILKLKTKKFSIIYFLDYGSSSLIYLENILKKNSKSIIAIANKEMIIAGGHFLRKAIKNSKNLLVPLDSEHFSIYRLNPINSEIHKLFITASGGPFYFKKNKDLNNVNKKEVLSHPKWKMGPNNTIDSSNFVNKILEIFELSIIYNIDINKIDFLISREAYVHSVLISNDYTVHITCFDNDMLIPMLKPITMCFKVKKLKLNSKKYLSTNNFKLDVFNDKRFKIIKHFKRLKELNHYQQISFMLLNNYAHSKYLNNKLVYSNIIDYILTNIESDDNNVKFNSFNDILRYIKMLKEKYEYI